MPAQSIVVNLLILSPNKSNIRPKGFTTTFNTHRGLKFRRTLKYCLQYITFTILTAIMIFVSSFNKGKYLSRARMKRNYIDLKSCAVYITYYGFTYTTGQIVK